VSAQPHPTGVFAAYFLISAGANAYMLAPASIVPLLVAHFEIRVSTEKIRRQPMNKRR